jgi:molybdopterin-containing oxidoreductase family membrane subunit
MSHLVPFLTHAARAATGGGPRYRAWMAGLTLVILAGGWAYAVQLRDGLAVTGMSDHVSWGFYISNFTFLVGVAAAAMMLVLPAYVLGDVEFGRAVLMAEAVAVGAMVMCLLFVIVDVGNPAAAWHLIPGIGFLNFPRSLLAWDVAVLNGYLAINLAIPLYILYRRFSGRGPDKRKYLPWMYVAVMWAVSIHLVTAFLLAGLPARPFWNSALLGPRFLASAFTAGPAFMIIVLWFIRRTTSYGIGDGAIGKLALITTVAAQVNLVMLLSELFYKFYSPTHHGINARYLFFGVEGHHALVPWIWTSIGLNLVATGVLMVHPLRRDTRWLMPACAVLFVAVWMEKGLGLVVPGFVPSPLGEIVEYTPTLVELGVTAGIWGLGLAVMTVLVRVALPIEMGSARSPYAGEPPRRAGVIPPRVRGRMVAAPVHANGNGNGNGSAKGNGHGNGNGHPAAIPRRGEGASRAIRVR